MQFYLFQNLRIDYSKIKKKLQIKNTIIPSLPALRIDSIKNKKYHTDWHQEIAGEKLGAKFSNYFQVWVKFSKFNQNEGLIIKENPKSKIFKHQLIDRGQSKKMVIIANQSFNKLHEKKITNLKEGDAVILSKYNIHKTYFNNKNKYFKLNLIQSFHINEKNFISQN